VDINELALFGATLNTIIPPTPRKLISTSKGLVEKFLHSIERTNQIPTLQDQLKKIGATQEWSQTQHDKLEQIDQEFTAILLEAESKCSVPIEYPWSPTLDKHSVIYSYWSLKIRGFKNDINIQ
jgi:hypothetical protein